MSDVNRTWRHFLRCGTIRRYFWRIIVIKFCILERNGYQHMNVVRHCMCFDYFYMFVIAEHSKDSANILPWFPVHCLSAVLWPSTMWYLQFQQACDKLFSSIWMNLLLLVVRLALPASILAKGGSFFSVSTLVLYSSTSIACGFVVNEKHAKGRHKIDLWRVSFTGSAAGPAAVSHRRRIARYFFVSAKGAAFPPWPGGIPGRPLSSA